jgi:hypothetical protein
LRKCLNIHDCISDVVFVIIACPGITLICLAALVTANSSATAFNMNGLGGSNGDKVPAATEITALTGNISGSVVR